VSREALVRDDTDGDERAAATDATSTLDPVADPARDGGDPPAGRARRLLDRPLVDRPRGSNLSTVLGIVHGDGPTSRSELTRLTGLNRSTIAALVGELVERGLVVESEPVSANRVGRPSPVVSASPDVVAFAVNPEIDAVTVGRVGLDGVVQRRVRHETEGVPTAVEAAGIAARLVRELAAEVPRARVVGVGAAVPGLVHSEGGLVRLAPHLGWVDEPFARLLSDAVELPAWAANDASTAVVAEGLFGAGAGARDLVFLNGGASGVGGGVVADGRPLRGRDGFAGEIGHTLVESAGTVCHCGAVGCLETEVGQSALLAVTGLTRGQADELDAALATALAEGDADVRREVERQVDYVAVALRNVLNAFNPSVIVLGGFLGSLLAAAPDRLLDRVTAQALPGPRDGVDVRRAALGADRLMIGAAELAFADLLADPARAS
jgi:predicted NBD/HSP70 family sugar kinase